MKLPNAARDYFVRAGNRKRKITEWRDCGTSQSENIKLKQWISYCWKTYGRDLLLDIVFGIDVTWELKLARFGRARCNALFKASLQAGKLGRFFPVWSILSSLNIIGFAYFTPSLWILWTSSSQFDHVTTTVYEPVHLNPEDRGSASQELWDPHNVLHGLLNNETSMIFTAE
jgi:hypothetical protein